MRRLSIALVLAAATSLLQAGASHAQTTPQNADPVSDQAQPTQLDDVVVEGRSIATAVDSFVDEIAAPLPGRLVSRWDGSICVGVANLRRDAAQIIVDRVSDVSRDIGLKAGEPGCSPNILIIAATGSQALTQALVEARPIAFRPPYAGASGTRASLAKFVETPRPVRWWYVTLPIDQDTQLIAVRIPGRNPPFIATLGGRLRTELRYDQRRTFVIVDMDDVQGLTLPQLGDYVAMVSLAQIDPDAETRSFDTILNLFDNRDPALELTDWDRAYLRALYAAELNQRSSDWQGGEVGSIMTRDRRAAQDDEQD